MNTEVDGSLNLVSDGVCQKDNMSSLSNSSESFFLSPKEPNLPENQHYINGLGASKRQNFPSLKFKTEKCKYWIGGGGCPFGPKCKFAHGEVEQRQKQFLPTKYKTRQCLTFQEQGHCTYGLRCKFIHHNNQHKLTYRTQLEFFCFLEEKERNSPPNYRLNIFKHLCSVQKEQEARTLWTSSTDETIQEESFISDKQIRSRQGSF